MFTFIVNTSLTDCVLLTAVQLLTFNMVYSEDNVTLASLTVNNKVFTYQMYTNISTWRKADSYCQGLKPTSHLAILDSKVKLSLIKTVLNGRNLSSLWTAGHQNESDSYWMWLNGKPLEKDQVSGNGDCLAVVNNITEPIACQRKSRYYACSFSASSCSIYGENLYNNSAECIKLFNFPDDSETNITWNDAKSSCLKMNGSLASLTDGNITFGANVTHVGGERYHRWWWAYGTEFGIKAISFTVNKAEPRGQCLVVTRGGVMAKNCNETYYVLCESTHIMANSMKWKIFVIIGVIFILLIGVITFLVRRSRRLRKKKDRPHSSSEESQQTDVIYSEALAAHLDIDPDRSTSQTGHRQTEPRRRPMVSPYAMARIESIIDRERQQNVPASTGTGSRDSQKQGSKTKERSRHSGNDDGKTVTSREHRNPDVVPDR